MIEITKQTYSYLVYYKGSSSWILMKNSMIAQVLWHVVRHMTTKMSCYTLTKILEHIHDFTLIPEKI